MAERNVQFKQGKVNTYMRCISGKMQKNICGIRSKRREKREKGM